MIETRGLTKSYGDFVALRGIDLQVGEGEIYGFIGPNGAGKTTTIKILTTLMEPTAGDASVAGLSVWEHKEEIRGLLGYMPDGFGVYPDMTVTEYLHFFAAAYGIGKKDRPGLVGGLLELTDLTYKEEALVDSLSKGMQQRLGLARALVHDPKVLVLDEPAAGLDPRARVELREILRELQSMGKTVLLSSHILSELEDICTRVGIIEQGRLVAQGGIDEILGELGRGRRVELRTTENAQALRILTEHSSIDEAARDDEDPSLLHVVLAEDVDVAVLSEILVGGGVAIRHLAQEQVSLEEAFMELTEGLVQ